MNNITPEYIAQEKALMNTLLDGYLLPLPSPTREEPTPYFVNELGLELIVRPECNQQCEYCYIYKHGKDLYPTRQNKENTLKNIDLILDYVYNQRKNFVYEIELFAGDMFYDEIYFDILDLIDKYLKQAKIDAPELFHRQILIACPCNLKWVYTQPELIPRFREKYHYFADEYGVFLSFSWSTDGFYAMSSREKEEYPESYFDTIFEFCKEFSCGYHPMIAPENISTWVENYDWWLKKYKQYDLDVPHYFQPYLLEVRNGNWTEKNIEDHNTFLDHVMQRRYERCNSDLRNLGLHLFFGDGREDSLLSAHGSDPIILWDQAGNKTEHEGVSCSAQGLIHFNATNLSLVQCHRTTYLQFTPLYFITDEANEHIVDFRPNNVGSYIAWRFHKPENYPICATCPYEAVCKKGCPGAQFEQSGELYMPITSLCTFFKEKYEHLYHLYKKWGLLELADAEGWLNQPGFSWLRNKYMEDKHHE